ncbi:MAG: hypothetical protein U0797_24685 [Gemmataceae bacterium]
MRQGAKGRLARLFVESLEARDCPAFSIFYAGTALVVRGTPTIPFAAPGDGLNFNLLAGGSLLLIQEVGNAGATVRNLGAYRPVRNLITQLNFTNTDVNFNLNGNRLVSNVLLDLGKGDINPGSVNSVNFQNGTVGGNLTILRGAGIEILNLGRTDANPNGALPVTVQGSVTAVGRPRQDPTGIGDSLFLNAGSRVLGFLSTFDIDNIDVGEGSGPVSRVARSVTLNVARSRNVGRLNIYGEVDGNAYFQGTNALDPNFTDSVILHGDNPTPGLVLGNLVAGYGFGDARMILEGGTEVQGDVVFSAPGAGSLGAPPAPFFNQLVLAGAIDGSMRFYGEGDSQIIFPAAGTVRGDFSVRAGNGNNDLSAFAGSVAGSLYVTLGNGDNVMTVSQAPGGRFYWTSGNGTNVLTLGDVTTPAGSLWDVQVLFGSGDDTLTLDGAAPATQSLTGLVRDDGSITGNTFNQGASWDLLPTLVFINFP